MNRFALAVLQVVVLLRTGGSYSCRSIVVLFSEAIQLKRKKKKKKRFLKEFFLNQWFSTLVWFAVEISEPIDTATRLIDIAARLIDTVAQKFNIFKTPSQNMRTNKRSSADLECGPRMDRNLPVKNRCLQMFTYVLHLSQFVYNFLLSTRIHCIWPNLVCDLSKLMDEVVRLDYLWSSNNVQFVLNEQPLIGTNKY